MIASKLSDHDFQRFTERTITDKAQFIAALAEVRDSGFAYNDREEYDHFHGISAPIFDYLGEPVAVLNIWTTYPQHPKSELLGWAPELVASASRVTGLIGGKAPDIASLS